ncbi:MAG: WecB/TagA/CpsF family glycosyltransferase [Bhargavaea sp.]
MEKIEVLNIELDNYTKEELLIELLESVKNNRKRFLVTANPEIIMMARQNPEFAEAIQSADYVVPDGIGLIIGSRIIGHPLKERIPGVELVEELLKISDENNLAVYFYGAKPEVLKRLLDSVNKKYPGIRVAGSSDGYTSSPEAVAKQIESKSPDIVFVAMGAPKQEEWIYRHFKNYSKGIFVGVGGSFDVLSGTVKRAPVIWRKLNLEWLYRLLRQPSRWRRMMLLPTYLLAVIRDSLKRKPPNE